MGLNNSASTAPGPQFPGYLGWGLPDSSGLYGGMKLLEGLDPGDLARLVPEQPELPRQSLNLNKLQGHQTLNSADEDVAEKPKPTWMQPIDSQ